MDASLRARAKEIFLDALEEPLERRDAFVRTATDGDEELHGAVRALLAGHQHADLIEGWMPGRSRPDDGLSVGDVLGSYELLAELDSGASGRVFRARQEGLEREVALKVPNAGRFASPAAIAQFRREAEAVARLDHPSIVPVHDVDEADGRHFFSMKLVEGGSLAERMERYADPESAARLVETVARAIHHAHQRGILHRDVKPSNILLDGDGTPFVADFGIAARVGDEQEGDRIAVAGTPAYMAPEQATPDGEPTTASDVWALGCVLFELIEGAPPFRGSTVTDSLRRARDEATPPMTRARSALSAVRAADLEAVVDRCLEKAPASRYGSARALAEDLRRWRAREHVAVRSPTFAERVHLRWQRQPWVSSLAAAVVALVLGIAVVAPLVGVELGRRLKRAEDAESAASVRLREALLAQAEATRRSAAPGRRARSLANLAEAAAIRPGVDLIDEAVRALALIDLVTALEWNDETTGGPTLCVDGEAGRGFLRRRDGTGRLVELATGDVLATVEAPSGEFRFAVLSRDARWVLARSNGTTFRDDPVVTLFDLRSSEATLEFREGIVQSRFAFDPTESRFALTGTDRVVTLHDCETGGSRELFELSSLASDVCFSPDGRALFAASGAGRELVRHDIAANSTEIVADELPHDTSTIEVGPDGDRILVGF